MNSNVTVSVDNNSVRFEVKTNEDVFDQKDASYDGVEFSAFWDSDSYVCSIPFSTIDGETNTTVNDVEDFVRCEIENAFEEFGLLGAVSSQEIDHILYDVMYDLD